MSQTTSFQPLSQTKIPLLNSNDLDKVLDDSAKTLADSQVEKKGRGRPKKDSSSPSMIAKGTPMKVSPDQYKTQIGSLLRFAGEFLATGSKFDGFRLTNEEVDLLATQGSDVASEFMPAIDSKYAKLGLFTVSAVSIYGIKYYTFLEMQKINNNKNKTVSSETLNNV